MTYRYDFRLDPPDPPEHDPPEPELWWHLSAPDGSEDWATPAELPKTLALYADTECVATLHMDPT